MSLSKEHAEQIERWMKDATPQQFVALLKDLLVNFLMHPRGTVRRADISEGVELDLQTARSHLRMAGMTMDDAERADVPGKAWDALYDARLSLRLASHALSENEPEGT